MSVIHWPAWKETGMAVNNEIDFSGEENWYVQPIATEEALEVLDYTICSGKTRVIGGIINVAKALEKGVYELKEELHVHDKSIVIKGSQKANEIEFKIACAWGEILGLREVDLYDNFYNLGGDSILAARLLEELDTYFPDQLDIADIFNYPSVKELANYLERQGIIASYFSRIGKLWRMLKKICITLYYPSKENFSFLIESIKIAQHITYL